MRHQSPDRARIALDVGRLGVSAACRLHGIHRSTWYRWEALPSRPGPEAAATLLRERIGQIALQHPSWGCDRIAFFLSFEEIRVSSPTIQKHLVAQGLGRRSQRELARNTQIGSRFEAPLSDVSYATVSPSDAPTTTPTPVPPLGGAV